VVVQIVEFSEGELVDWTGFLFGRFDKTGEGVGAGFTGRGWYVADGRHVG